MSNIAVFISSAKDEQSNERYNVQRRLEELDIQAFVFESGSTNLDSLRDVWHQRREENIFYIGIFYRKYSTFPIEEFYLARSANLPCFIYIYNFQKIHENERDPDLQAFLKELEDSNVEVGYYASDSELVEKIVHDITNWLYKDLTLNLRKLTQVKGLLEEAKHQIADKEMEIGQLGIQLIDISASPLSEREELTNQLGNLMTQEKALREQLENLEKTEYDLSNAVAESEKQFLKIQILASTPVHVYERKLGAKEEIAEDIRQFFESRLGAHINVIATPQHIDLEIQYEMDELIHSLMLRIVDAPLTPDEKHLFEKEVASLSLSRGFLVITSQTSIEQRSTLSNNKLMSVLMIDPSTNDFEKVTFSSPGTAEVDLLIRLGDEQFALGSFQIAVARFEEAVAQAHALNRSDRELEATAKLANTWENIGNYQKAIEVITRLLVLARQLKQENYEVQAVLRLAEALAHLDLQGRWRELKPLLLEGLAISHSLGNSLYEVNLLMRLGEYAIAVGEDEQGFAWLQEALNRIQPSIGREQNFVRSEIFKTLSFLMSKHGEYSEAKRYAEAAAGSSLNYGNPKSIASAHLRLAIAEQSMGERTEALRLIGEVLSQAQQMYWKDLEQEAEYLRAEVARELGQADVAEVAARQALNIAQEFHLKEKEVESLLSLGRALIELKRKDEANKVLKQAQQLSQERDYENHFVRATRLLKGVE